MPETPKSSESLDSTKYIVLYCMMFVKIEFEIRSMCPQYSFKVERAN